VTDHSSLRLALFTDTYAPQVNGVARTLARLTEAVRARGGDVAVFTPHDPAGPSPAECERFASVAFWAYPQLRLAHPLAATVDARIAAFSPTLIHAATPFGMGLAGRSAALRHGIPFVSSYHTSFAAYAAYYRLGALAAPGWHFLRWFHNSGQRTYCPTHAIVREVRGHGFERTAVWSRGVDVTRFAPHFRQESLRRSIGVKADERLVLYVGRLAAEKGLDVALTATEAVAAQVPGVRFAFVGDGPFADDVRRRAPAGTWLPGSMHGEALSAAFASADCFLFPSTTDTFGNVLLEAAASGLPIVAADAPPTRELLADSGAALLVPPTDAVHMARAVARVCHSDDMRRVMSSAARVWAESKSWARVWDDLLEDYAAVRSAPRTIAAA
jgi:phosphatidylinositol alpha 1,6-mannosyltransferase